MILYIETNFLAGFAMGRDIHAAPLLQISPVDLRISLPAVCVMEAWSVYEDERKRRNGFENILSSQLSQLRRDLTSLHARALIGHLQQARTENVDLLNEIQSRLNDLQEKLAGLQSGFAATELLPLTSEILAGCLPDKPTKDPTDNLILAVILNHASQNPNENKVFLSGNTRDFGTPEIRALLSAVGITEYFGRTDAFLGWFQAQKQTGQ